MTLPNVLQVPQLATEEAATDALPPIELRPATEFSTGELADIYNQTRMDYIVPMPMNAARLEEYIHTYNVHLEYSAVAMSDGQILGLSMLGVRPRHTWITRLGIIPVLRRRGTGESLMRYHMDTSLALGVDYVTLDVIKNNVPAQRLFKKLGFEAHRELLILRRPPGLPKIAVEPYAVTWLDEDEAIELLQQRRQRPTWLTANESLINGGGLAALKVTLPDGSHGWLAYQKTIFQLGRLVAQTEAGDPHRVARALAHALHTHHPLLDTKTENFLLDDPHLSGFQELGYIESFRRIELRLDLTRPQPTPLSSYPHYG